MEDKKALSMVLLAVFIDLLGFGIILPVLPYFTTDFLKASEFEYSVVIALYSLAQFVFAPIWGRISDNVGRRPIMLIGLFGSSIAFLLTGMSRSLYMLYFSRALAGFFTGASLPTARAYIADTTAPEKRAAAFGLIGAAFGLGFTLGPAFGSLLARISLFGIPSIVFPSYAAAILTFFNFVGAVFWLPESRKAVSFTEISSQAQLFNIAKMKKLLSLPRLSLLIFTFATVSLIFSGFEAMFSLFANYVDSSINERTIGLVFLVIGVVLVLVQGGLIRVLVKRIGEQKTIITGLFFLAFGMFVYPYSRNLLELILAAVPLAVGMGLVNPALNSEISKRVSADDQGGIMGITSGISSLMRVIGVIIAGYLYTFSYFLHFYIGAIVFFALLAINIVPDNSSITSSTPESMASPTD